MAPVVQADGYPAGVNRKVPGGRMEAGDRVDDPAQLRDEVVPGAPLALQGDAFRVRIVDAGELVG